MSTATTGAQRTAPKMYVMLDALDATAPVFNVVNNQRIRITKVPRDSPFLQVTFMDNTDRLNKTIRYKSNSNYIFQSDQIEKEKMLANEQFTQTEREDLIFKNGLLVAPKEITQKFLDKHPQNENFDGICDHVRQPMFKELDKGKEIKTTNEDLRKRTKAAGKILGLELEEAQALLIRLNGSFFDTPEDVEECQNMLIDFLDDTNDAGLDDILKEDDALNIDETTTVLIGKLINSGLLSFDQVEGKISKKAKDGKWIVLRDMSNEYGMDEKKRLFSDFLNTADGKALKNDLENDIKNIDKPKANKSK